MRPRFDSRPLLSRRNYTTAIAGRPLPGPGPDARVHGAHLMCVIAASVVARNVANQEMLLAMGPNVLGEAYIAVSLVTGFVLALLSWLSRNVNPRAVARTAHAVVFVLVAAAYVASSALPDVHGVLVAKYIAFEIASAMLLLVFGLMLGARLGPRDARRNASMIGVGGIIGGLLGGAVLRTGASVLGSANLYPFAAVFALAPVFFLPKAKAITFSDEDDDRDRAEVDALAPYGRWVAITTLLMVATTTVIDFQYRAAAASWYPSDEMTSFFGSVALLTGLATLILQLTVVDRLLTRVGLFAAATVMPAALVLCSGFFGLFPGALTLIFLKLVDSGTNMSVQQATGGLLLAPLSSRARAVWQGRIDGVAKRGGQALAGLYLASTTWSPVRLVPVVLMLCAMWLVSVLITRIRYVDLLTDMLGAPGSNEPEVSAVDGDTVRMLLRELPRAAPTRAAVILDLLEDAGHSAPERVLVELAESHPGSARRVVEHFANLGDVTGLKAFSAHRDMDIAADALLALVEVSPEAAMRRSREVLADASPEPLQALAAGVLVEQDKSAFELCQKLARSTRIKTRIAAARALCHARSTRVLETLDELVSDASAEVSRSALKALSGQPGTRAIEVAVRALHRRDVRGEAKRALADMGTLAGNRVATELHRNLNDPSVASALTWVLGRIGTRNGLEALLDALSARHVETRLATAAALTTLQRQFNTLEISFDRLSRHFEAEATYFDRMRRASAAALPRSPAGLLLTRALKQRSKASLECLFRLFALHYPDDVIHSAFAGLASREPRQRQIALELLHTVIDPKVGAMLGRAVANHTVEPDERKRLLHEVARNEDRFVGGLARAVLVELGLAPVKALGDAMTQSLVNQILELQALSLFRDSSAEDLAEVASLVRAKTFPKGEELYREGDRGDACYLLRAGAVSIHRDGDEIDRLGPGDACGFIAILDQLPREATAITASECSVFVIQADELIQLLADRPLLMHSMFRALTHSIRNPTDRVALEKRG